MKERRWQVVAGASLALGALAAGPGEPATTDEKDLEAAREAQPLLMALVKSLARGEDGKKEAAQIKKRFPDDLTPVMSVFRSRARGGLGIGPRGAGIEEEITQLARRPLPAAKVAAQKEVVERIGEVTRAVAQMADLYPPRAMIAEWTKFNDEMRRSAEGLVKAAGLGSPKDIQRSATRLYESCKNCHTSERPGE